jgi:hypothetical protein
MVPETTFPRVEFPAVRVVAKRLVEEATDEKEVEEVALVERRFVEEAVVEKKLVVVALVEVEFLAVKFWRVVEEVTRSWEVVARVTLRFERVVRPPVAVTVPVKLAAEEIVWPLMVPEVTLAKVALPTLRAVAKRLVEEATEAKKLVVVALVEVELRAVKLRSVVEPLIKRFESEVNPPVAVTVPVKFAAEEMVWPLIAPEVTFPRVAFPTFNAVAKRLVDEATEAKKFVVVALVEVELRAVKLSSVEEPERRRFESEVRPPVAVTVPVKLAAEEIVWPLIKPEVIAPRVALPTLRAVAKRLVDEATEANEVEEVALVEKRLVELAVVEKKLVVVALVVVERSTKAPPVISSLEDVEEVAVAPINTWLVVVER